MNLNTKNLLARLDINAIAWQNRIRLELLHRIDEGGTLHGLRVDGQYVTRDSAGDRFVHPGEDGTGRTERATNTDRIQATSLPLPALNKPKFRATKRPVLHVIAGANGAGKSTFTESGFFGGIQVIDPDVIARTISPDDPESVAATAGREALTQRSKAMAAGEYLAVETTLSSHSSLKLMDKARESGYSVELHYIGLGDHRFSIDRVADRVTAGGHGVPERDIRRRFERSHINLIKAIKQVDHVTLYNNVDPGNPHERVAEVNPGEIRVSTRVPDWARIVVQVVEQARNSALKTLAKTRSACIDEKIRLHCEPAHLEMRGFFRPLIHPEWSPGFKNTCLVEIFFRDILQAIKSSPTKGHEPRI